MNQWEFDTIMGLIQNGAPAFANQLCNSFAQLVQEHQELTKQEPEAVPENNEKEND